MENKMFCFQCQETAGCTGCTKFGVCGKSPDLARMQDLLVYTTKGLSEVTTRLRKEGKEISSEINHFITLNLFTTITNANFDDEIFYERVNRVLEIKEELLNKLSNKNSRIKYSVVIGNYGVDIDKDYEVLGFSNKNLGEVKYKAKEISEEDAIYLAKSYISKITKDDFSFKEIKSKEDSDSLVYNVVFNKYRDGYPCYKQEINTLINKITGKLEGYTNYPIEYMNYIDKINIDEKEATEILNNNFKSLKLNGTIEGNPTLAYINVSDKEMVLAYMFNIKITSSDIKEEMFLSFVRADTSEVINYNLEAVAKK